LVSLYAIRLHSEDQMKYLTNGKLWTVKQIEAEMKSNLFSEYFRQEFPYLQTTILLPI
jgi:hypothetical protein